MKETITFPFTKHGTGALEKDHFSPPQKNRLWIRSLTPLSVIINVLYCIVMYCQWQLAEVSLMRHLWRAIFLNFQEIGDDRMLLEVRDINYSILPVYHSSFIPMRLFFKKYVCSFIYKLSF